MPRALNNLAGLAFLDLAQNSIRLSTTLLSKCFKKKIKEPWEWGAEQPWVDHSLEPGEKCDPGAGTGGLLWDQRHPLQPQPPQQSADQLPHRGHHQFARAQGEWEFFFNQMQLLLLPYQWRCWCCKKEPTHWNQNPSHPVC